MMSSVARINFIKTKAGFSYHTKGISNQASSNPDREKTKKWEKTFWVRKRDNNGDYKLGQEASQIGKKVTNWGKEISNRGERNFRPGHVLQIGAGITTRCRTLSCFSKFIKKCNISNFINVFDLLKRALQYQINPTRLIEFDGSSHQRCSIKKAFLEILRN